MEQAQLRGLLQLVDFATQRRLVDIQVVGGFSEIQFLCQQAEHP
ncbi:hypothetical protein JCM19237_1254 [Photobacterium aphoticum]|uniref:Uncharacterized protein n=1 Tax=Photobacterium aphoticum TaxID=754436 RepID=A0A090RAI0_9GAMM|nr:hypothetical protein JCM19237_1254 [Photobacterium aphoticum]